VSDRQRGGRGGGGGGGVEGGAGGGGGGGWPRQMTPKRNAASVPRPGASGLAISFDGRVPHAFALGSFTDAASDTIGGPRRLAPAGRAGRSCTRGPLSPARGRSGRGCDYGRCLRLLEPPRPGSITAATPWGRPALA